MEESRVQISIEYGASNPVAQNNLALEYGFDPSVIVWSDDAHVRAELRRLLTHARYDDNIGGKSLVNVNLSEEKPFDFSSAIFEDVDMENLTFPKGTDLAGARMIGCNLYGVNFKDCIVEVKDE